MRSFAGAAPDPSGRPAHDGEADGSAVHAGAATPGADACPACSLVGEPATFQGVRMCFTDGCRVWTYERAADAGASGKHEARARRGGGAASTSRPQGS